MNTPQQRLKKLGIGIPDIMVPNKSIDLRRWAVVACDQYTSEIDYWQRVDAFVGDHPSTLRLIYPEVYLDQSDEELRIKAIKAAMHSYVDQHLFDTYAQSFFLIRRTNTDNTSRWGLLLALDLEAYDYSVDSKSPIRATEETIVSRIPPRLEIRKDSCLEVPHILVLINDCQKAIIEPLASLAASLAQVYETTLMEQGGSLQAYRIQDSDLFARIADGFEHLAAQADPANPIVFAMGDGNHSLATAKSNWERIKKDISVQEQENHPARYALVEVNNIYDEGLEFEPIHRVLFQTSTDQFFAHLKPLCSSYTLKECETMQQMIKELQTEDHVQRFGMVHSKGMSVIALDSPKATIAAGTLQLLVDDIITTDVTVDYTHGVEITQELGLQEGNIGLILPPVFKDAFFETIMSMGAFPRKTFSIGQAHQKRFYLEVREILPST